MSAISKCEEVRSWFEEHPWIQEHPKECFGGCAVIIATPLLGVNIAAVALCLLVKSAVSHPTLNDRLRRLNDHSCDRNLGIYVTTNELITEKVRRVLSQIPRSPVDTKRSHIGFSTIHNFDIMAMRKSDYALLSDYNPYTGIYIRRVLHIMRSVSTREELVERLIAYTHQIKKTGNSGMHFMLNTRNYMTTEDEIKHELSREGSWLSTDHSFEYIKTLNMAKRIVVITLDIRNTLKYKQIAAIYEQNRILIDTLYVSNIEDYMKTCSDKLAYFSTVDALSTDDTIIISSSVRDYLKQRISTKKETKARKIAFLEGIPIPKIST